MKNEKVNGKVAFITGANRGLGLETARELGKQGIAVVLGSRDSKKGEVAAAKLRDEGVNAESLGFDITKPQDHQKASDYFAKKYGHLDILVNPAFGRKATPHRPVQSRNRPVQCRRRSYARLSTPISLRPSR